MTFIVFRSDCNGGRCMGYNERKNIFNAARHFTTFLLPHGAPISLRKDVDFIVSAYSNATVTSKELLSLLNRVINDFKSGRYLRRDKNLSAISKNFLSRPQYMYLLSCIFTARVNVVRRGCNVSTGVCLSKVGETYHSLWSQAFFWGGVYSSLWFQVLSVGIPPSLVVGPFWEGGPRQQPVVTPWTG